MKHFRSALTIFTLAYLILGADVRGESIYDFEADMYDKSNLNYPGLRSLYTRYRKRGFNVIAFPCDQFGHQAPGTSQEERDAAIAKFGFDFDVFDKINVNGRSAHPLYKYLKKEMPVAYPYRRIAPSRFYGKIEWNYAKFVINRKGKPVGRYLSHVDPLTFEDLVVKLLNETAPAIPTT